MAHMLWFRTFDTHVSSAATWRIYENSKGKLCITITYRFSVYMFGVPLCFSPNMSSNGAYTGADLDVDASK